MNARLISSVALVAALFAAPAAAQPPGGGPRGDDVRSLAADLAKLKSQLADLESRMNRMVAGGGAPGRGFGTFSGGSSARSATWGRAFGGTRQGLGTGGAWGRHQHGHHGHRSWGHHRRHRHGGSGTRAGFYGGIRPGGLRAGGGTATSGDVNRRLDRIERQLQELLRSLKSGR